MADRYAPFRWDRVRGFSDTEPPASLPDFLAVVVQNSELTGQQALVKKRPVTTALDLTSGPTQIVRWLFEFVTAAGVSELWAFSGNDGQPLQVHRRVSGVWSTVSLAGTDPVDVLPGNLPHAAVLNGKLFLAWGSTSNFLHLWNGTTIRRVGIENPATPSVANTGVGTYPAVLRFYKVQASIRAGADTIAESELSTATSFTPSGTGLAARITKPTTTTATTHWRVFGSADDVSFFDLSGWIVVATTIYDDSENPANYGDGELAPPLGINIPPPAARFLATDGNRLLMAGAFEPTTTRPGQTAPRTSRVWFTPVLGTSDRGDDERIPNSLEAGLKNWIDVGEQDGDEITGLAGPIDGLIYVFKRQSIWRLIPTGSFVTPYRALKVLTGVGSHLQYGLTVGEIGIGEPAIYFWGSAALSTAAGTLGPYRISPSRGLEWLGKDIHGGATISAEAGFVFRATWWPRKRQVFFSAGFDWTLVVSVDWLQLDGLYWRGGWAFYRWSLGAGGVAVTNLLTLAVQNAVLTLGGHIAANAAAIATVGTGTTDAGGVIVNPTVTSKAWLLGQGGRNRITAENPIVETFANVVATVAYRAEETAATDRSGATLGTGGAVREAVKLESVEAADTRALQAIMTLSNAAAGDVIEALTIPFTVKEAL